MIEAIGGDTQVALGFGFAVAMTVGGAILGQVVARTRHGHALEGLREDIEELKTWRQKATKQLAVFGEAEIRRDERKKLRAEKSSSTLPRPE